MKWALGTLVLVLILLVGGIFMANQVWAPENDLNDIFDLNDNENSDFIPSRNKIEVYDGVSVSENIETMDLSDRQLRGSLKAEVRHLSNLKSLDLSHNQFTGLPAEVGQLNSLTRLNLSYNNLTGLPHELGNLSELTYLNLAGNDISEIDLEIIKQRLPVKTEIYTDEYPEPVACTMDAKQCPDGSYVGRTGPNCEFAACPSSDNQNPNTVTCTEEMKNAEACTMEYAPVCGLVQIQCITTPCNPIPETFGNGCSACAQGNVISYSAGECQQ